MYRKMIENFSLKKICLVIVALAIQLGSVFVCDLILLNCVYVYNEGNDQIFNLIIRYFIYGIINIFSFACFCILCVICNANCAFCLRVFLVTKWFYSTYNFMNERNITLMNVFMLTGLRSNDVDPAANHIEAYFKMMILNSTQTIISIMALSMLIELKFKLIGHFINKIIASFSIPTSEENVNVNQQNQYSYLSQIGVIFFINCYLINLSSQDEHKRILLFFCIFAYLCINMLVRFHPFIDSKLFHLASSNRSFRAFGPHLRTLSFSLLFVCANVYLIKRPEVNGMYSLICILLLIRTALSLIIYVLLVYDFNRMNTRSLDDNSNTFLNNIDELVFRLKLFSQIVGYIQELAIL